MGEVSIKGGDIGHVARVDLNNRLHVAAISEDETVLLLDSALT